MIIWQLQPVFSPSVLAEIMRPGGSSTVSVISGESLSAELAHELMSIQVIPKRGSFLFVFCGGLRDELESEERFRVPLHDYMKNAIMGGIPFALWLMASK